eukprot:g24913.t1
MAALLQKVLKVLVSRACQLPPVFQVGASKSGGAEATHFRDAFQSYLEHYFVNEGAERPAERGEVGFGTPRRGLPGDRAGMPRFERLGQRNDPASVGGVPRCATLESSRRAVRNSVGDLQVF